MPERPLTIATYAAGASLAAITLVYVFGPTFFLDDEAANSSKSSRKKGVVGLSNPANDCFINSVLQALAGLPELRLYLIRETHRRNLDGAKLYADPAAALESQKENKTSRHIPESQLLGLQQGLVTAGLKDILDALNERPIYKKTITAHAFIRIVEDAFRTKISRSQQDAQEFLQIVAERLDDEHHAGRRVRRRAKRRKNDIQPDSITNHECSDELNPPGSSAGAAVAAAYAPELAPRDSKVERQEESTVSSKSSATNALGADTNDNERAESFSFPLEGKLESQVECLHCQFKPRPHPSSFVTLTLNVPQDSGSTSLNSCFDGMFKQEYIDDFTCDRCRLEHALLVNSKQLLQSSLSDEDRTKLQLDRRKIEDALHEDPAKPPKDVKLPELSSAPKRRISRHMRISTFPRVLSLHLSRSIWARHTSSSKNTSKVTFPETLPLGGLLNRKTYRLLAVVTHKGGHNSGHYETFRRQFLGAPYSTPASMGTEGIYSVKSSPAPSPGNSAAPSPSLQGQTSKDTLPDSPLSGTNPRLPFRSSPSTSSGSSSRTSNAALDRRRHAAAAASVPLEAIPTPGLPPPPTDKQTDPHPRRRSSLSSAISRVRPARKQPDRWWRISDDKIKECKTSEILSMQREVYLLFYELIDDERE